MSQSSEAAEASTSSPGRCRPTPRHRCEPGHIPAGRGGGGARERGDVSGDPFSHGALLGQV